jgi:hypothetical protein
LRADWSSKSIILRFLFLFVGWATRQDRTIIYVTCIIIRNIGAPISVAH